MKQLAEKYPQGWEKFIDFSLKKLMTMREKTKSMLQIWDENPILKGAVEKLLTEFFRENKIYFSVVFINEMGTNYKDMWKLIVRGMPFAEEYFCYNGYESAFESGIEKCFEIYESQLKEK
jgi:hypothetical protein